MEKMRYSTRRRLRKFFSFISFNLLFFALYLNFVKKDPAPVSEPLKVNPRVSVTAQEFSSPAKKGI
jgi:hypothetical protein